MVEAWDRLAAARAVPAVALRLLHAQAGDAALFLFYFGGRG